MLCPIPIGRMITNQLNNLPEQTYIKRENSFL